MTGQLPPPAVSVGDPAPDFDLPDQHRQPVRLSDYQGKRHVLLVFYPLAFTSVCDGELCALRDDLDAYDNEEAALIAVSCDSSATHRRQAEEHGYRFPLLADFWPHGEVAQRYGVFDKRFGVARRASFAIDRDGVIRWWTVNDVPDPRDPAAAKAALAELTARG